MGKLKRWAKEVGDEAENRAVEFLKKEGFLIIDRNFYAKKYGEIDIIAKKEDILHFIEVKSSQTDFNPIYNVTPNKLNRLIKSVEFYLSRENIDFYAYSIDALIIKKDSIELIENITI